MPDEDSEFLALMQQLREGSEEAAWQLVERHGDAIRRAVRRALDRRLRPKFDSLDFVQIVWNSFFRTRDQTDRFTRPEELVAFLVRVTQNKVGMEIRRRLKTEKYDIRREFSLEDLRDDERLELAQRQTPPIESAIAHEHMDRLVQDQPERDQEIVRLKYEGHSCTEIAHRLKIAESTVRRVLKRLLNEDSPE